MSKPKRLVVDACVARASGPPASKHPTATNCRKCLEAIRKSKLQIVATDAIKSEWRKHQSNFFRTWIVSMYGRRRVLTLDITEDTTMRRRVADAFDSREIVTIVLKDFHLVEAAICTDNRIISLETKFVKHLRSAYGMIKELDHLMVANPDSESDGVVRWLEGDCPSNHSYKLG